MNLFGQKEYISISALIFVVIIYFFVSDKLMAFLKMYTHFSESLGWNSLNVFYGFFQSFITNLPSLLFYAFLIGLAIVTFKTILILDQVKKFKVDSENLEFKSDLFNLLLLFGVLFVFVFIMRANTFEYRWFFPLLPAMLAFTVKGIIIPSDYLASLAGKKYLAIILIILISVLGVYTQINHADSIIKMKLDSYSQVRDAALWLKESYSKDTRVLSISYPQTVYYSELNVSTYSGIINESEFNNYLNKTRTQILEVSAFEPIPPWVNSWLQENQNRINPVQVYYQDLQKQQPILIIYELSY